MAGLWTPLENWSLQKRFQWRGFRPSAVPLVLVAIDDRSIARLGRLPWDRRRFAQLLDRLEGAAVVGIDVLFSEPTAQDALLARAIARQGRVVLAAARTPTSVRLEPVPPLAEVSAGIGDIGAGIFGENLQLRTALVVPKSPRSDLEVETFGTVIARLYASLAGLSQPSVPDRIWLNWPGPARSLPSVSAIDVLEGKVAPARFADQIVLVGVTATAVDALITPFDTQASGIALHWTVVDNLLGNSALAPWPGWLTGLVAVMSALGLGFLLTGRPGWLQLTITLAWAAGWVGLAVVLFWRSSIWLPLAAPAGALILAGGFSLIEGEQRTARRLEIQRERRKAQQAVTDSLATALVAATGDGRIYFQNPASAPFFPENRSTPFLGEQLQALGWLSAEQWAEAQAALGSGQPSQRQVNLGERDYRLRLVPLSQDEQVGGILCAIEDITAQLELERLRQQMLGMLSHDIRSPLTNIRGFAELLKISPPSSDIELEEMVDPILSSAERVQGLVSDFLALARIESPAFDLKVQPLSVQARLRPLMAELRPQAEARHSRLVAEDWPKEPLIIAADPLRFDQIFMNLLTNALKYGPDSQTIRVRLSLDSPWVAIAVIDEGFGIPDAALERIWEPFYRVKTAQTEGIPGTGLGLAITRKLVELHTGSIAVTSNPGQGSCFSVRFRQQNLAPDP